MLSQMNTYENNPTNSYGKRFVNKNRRKTDTNSTLTDTKRLKSSFRIDPNSSTHRIDNSKSETYNFLQEDAAVFSSDLIHELYEESPIEFNQIVDQSSDNYGPYLNENEHQNIVDENSVFIDGDIEEYSIDYIDESDGTNIDCFNFVHYPDGALFGHPLSESPFVSQPAKSKRKQGIVGRPTLSSPQRLLVPDNVYSRGNPIDNDNYFTDNNYRNNHRQSIVNNGSNGVRISVKRSSKTDSTIEFDEINRYSGYPNRNRPRILTKPIVQESQSMTSATVRHHHHHQQQSQIPAVPQAICLNTTEQDAFELAQRTVANREFARNLVKRAERQGTVIDKNKIPMSVFEHQPVEVLMKTALDEQLSAAIAEIKETEQFVVSQPFTTTVNVSDGRRMAATVVKKSSNPQLKPPHNFTASDLLKQKWKAANRQQS